MSNDKNTDPANSRVEIVVKAKESLRGSFVKRGFAFEKRLDCDQFVKAVKASADSLSLTMRFKHT